MKTAQFLQERPERTSFIFGFTGNELSDLMSQMAESIIQQVNLLNSRFNEIALFSRSALDLEITLLENSFVRFLYNSATTASSCFELSDRKIQTIIRALSDYQRFKTNVLRKCTDAEKEHYLKDVFAKIDWTNVASMFHRGDD